MNLLLITPKDTVINNTLKISGRRAEHIFCVLRAKAGDQLRAGLLNGNLGTATVLEATKKEVTVKLDDFPNPPPEKVDFIPCTAWRATAEFIGKYFHKGDFIGITGAIEVSNYEKNGEPRTDICVKVNRAEFTQNKTAAAPGEKAKPTLQPIDDDGDIPF